MFRKALAVIAVGLLLAAPLYAAEQVSADLALRKAIVKIEEGIARLNDGLMDAAEDLSTGDATEQDIRRVIKRLARINPVIIDCAFVDKNGIMTVIEPGEYHKFQGSDISKQPQISEVRRGKPVASDVFLSVEGASVVDLEHPVISESGEFIGSVSLIFKPEAFLKKIIQPLEELPQRRFWIMQLNGLILYDSDPAQTGLNIFTSNSFRNFPGVLSFAKRVAYRPNGQGSYDFRSRDLIDSRIVRKDATWGTVALNNKEWRVVVVDLYQPKF